MYIKYIFFRTACERVSLAASYVYKFLVFYSCVFRYTLLTSVTRVLRRVLVRVSSYGRKRGVRNLFPPRVNFEATGLFLVYPTCFFSLLRSIRFQNTVVPDLRKGRGSSLQSAEPVLRIVEVCYCISL